MIDFIRIVKPKISEDETKELAKKNALTKVNTNGIISYNNKIIKNVKGGLYIQIDKRKTLTIRGSVHKYSSFKKGNKNTNFDFFTMKQAKETILQIIKDTGLNYVGTTITAFEVGINLNFNFDVKKIIKEIYSIKESKSELYNNPKYKNESYFTTEFDKGKRVVYKMYDKTFEMKQKRHIIKPPNSILRMEILNKRPSIKKDILQFIEDENLNKIQDNFFRKFNTLKFNAYVLAPKGTSLIKIQLATELYKKGKDELLKEYNRKRKNKIISNKMYYTYANFIKKWDELKKDYPQKNYDFMTEWQKQYNVANQIFNLNKLI